MGSFTCLTYHIAFATKYRKPTIKDDTQERLYEYMGGIAVAASRLDANCCLYSAGLRPQLYALVASRLGDTNCCKTVIRKMPLHLEYLFSATSRYSRRGSHVKFLTLNIRTLAMMFLISFVCTESGSGEDKIRTWTSASGKKKFELKLVRVAGNITTKNEEGNEVVAFEDANGKRYQSLVKNLSEFDQEVLAKLKGELKPTDPKVRLPAKHRAFFQTHCLDCHDSDTQEGKVNLEELSFQITTLEQAELWQKVLNALNAGEMPPEDSEQPANKEKTDFLDDLAGTMVAARRAMSDSGGKITMRRLNRREYQNSIEFLTGVRVDVASLLSDGGPGTFDTVGATQFISGDQIEQYLKIGRSAIDELFQRYAALHAPAANTWKQRREVEEHANAKVGGTYYDYFKDGHEKGIAFLKTGEPQKGVIDEQQAKFRIGEFEHKGPSFRRYLDDPLTKTGALLTISKIYESEFIALPPEHASLRDKTKHVVDELPPGDYKLRFRIGSVKGTPAERHFVDLGAVPEEDQFKYLATFQVTGSTDEPQTIEVPVTLTLDGPRKFALREKRDPKADEARYKAAREETGVGLPPALWIDWVEWEGPMSSSDGKSMKPDWWVSRGTVTNELSWARKILEQFAVQALRGDQPESEFIDRLLGIFKTRRRAGETFAVAIRTPLSVILASPGFLYLNEPNLSKRAVESQRRELTDRELAVRLSYFLWSSPPDWWLLDLAERNKLHQPEVLRQQVGRLIADPRCDEFVSGFVHQWLDMERLDFFEFDTLLHREFDESTRSACRQEVYQSFAHLLRDKRSGRLGKLLKSDYVFINGLLATYYGIDGVTGDEFHKVKLPTDSPRGGLLGMAAIHAMGSDGTVSSPVERGAWVLRHLLNDPPPPAPPNVPQISRLQGQVLTKRERVQAHQEEAQCASCHRKIDPIGFGLENWDAAGRWRTTDSYQLKNKRGRPMGKAKSWEIDASGALHKGPGFSDYQELRDVIAEREEDFARGFTEHLIEYALGRPFGFSDENLANEIVSSAKSKQFVLSAFVHSVIQSKAFRTK